MFQAINSHSESRTLFIKQMLKIFVHTCCALVLLQEVELGRPHVFSLPELNYFITEK